MKTSLHKPERGLTSCRKNLFAILSLTIITLIAYSNTFDASWHFDDFPNINKKFKATMLPSEVAELMIAELKASPSMAALTVVTNDPAEIAGKHGVQLHVRYKNPKGLQFDNVTVAFGDKSGFYVLNYRAPSLHFFNRYLPVFEKIRSSFTLNKTKLARTGIDSLG